MDPIHTFDNLGNGKKKSLDVQRVWNIGLRRAELLCIKK
jgi:hypothetical protein